MITVTVSSGAIRRKALGLNTWPAPACPLSKRFWASRMPTYRLAPMTAPPMRKLRRSRWEPAVSLMASSWCGNAWMLRYDPIMQLEFFGAAGEVTGSCHIVRAGGRQLLLDCGMIQGNAADAARNRQPFPFDAADVDAVVLSHAHVDHCGRLPLLVRRGFRGPIHTNAACADLLPILLRDSADLALREAERANRNSNGNRAAHEAPAEPLFSLADVDAVVGQVVAIPYDTARQLFPGITVRVRDAGHILGSS